MFVEYFNSLLFQFLFQSLNFSAHPLGFFWQRTEVNKFGSYIEGDISGLGEHLKEATPYASVHRERRSST